MKPYIQLGRILVQQLQSCIGSVMQMPLQAGWTPMLRRSGACPKKLKQWAKRGGRRVGCRAPDICIAELQGPLDCLQIKGPLDSSHQTPSSRTPPFISSFSYPPKRSHYVDTLHDLFAGVAAMEGSGSTWRPGTSREIGGSNSGDTHGAALKSGDGAGNKTQRVLGL